MDTDTANEPTATSGDAGAVFPPVGWVTWEGTARFFGISPGQFGDWLRTGRFAYKGKLVNGPNGRRGRIWAIAELEEAKRAMANPVGWVSSAEAMALFDVASNTFCRWVKDGIVPTGRNGHAANGTRIKLYPLDELKRIKERMDRRYDPVPDAEHVGCYRVPIVSEKIAASALVDAADLPVLAGRHLNWSTGSKRNPESGAVVLSGLNASLARTILGVNDPALLVCQVNGDRLDCRRANLVVRTKSEASRLAKRVDRFEAIGDPYVDPTDASVVRVPVCTELHAGMEALIDAADLPLIEGKQWNYSPGKRGDGRDGSVVLRMGGTPKPTLSRIIMGVTEDGQLVSHVNGDRLDCRRANLILRTRSQVSRARRKSLVKAGRVSTSRFKGVSRTESGRKWSATIAVGGRTRQLGRFRSEIDAALAYDAAASELFGEHARLNLPDAAEVERLRALEPAVEDDATWPPAGMVDRHEACAMFGVAFGAWLAWEKKGRITCGAFHPLPNDKPGRCKLYPRDELERVRVEIEALGKPYPDPERPGVWRVPLKSYLAHREALIDAADLPIVEGKNWNWSERSDGRTEGTVVLATTGSAAALHRLIMGVTDKATRVAFLNGDALDCRRENLAVRTLAETNHTNRKMASRAGKTCSSRFKGVSHDVERGRWTAQIRKGQVYQHVGRFHDELAAAQAYDDCARVLFGPHAYVNFPDRESSEQDRAWAQRVLDGSAAKDRVKRRKLKKLERKLKRAALELKRTRTAVAASDGSETGATISRKLARLLFGATRPVWRRWRRLGWLPAPTKVGTRNVYRLADVERLLARCGKRVLPYPDPELAGVYRLPLVGKTCRGREAMIDADVVPMVLHKRWRFALLDQGRGGEVQTINPAENMRLHQVAMGVTGDDRHVGFRNDDPFDCRRANLVMRTLTDTAAHKRKQAMFNGQPCTSRFKGVCKPKKSKRWVASIKKDRVQRRLGTFHDEIAAAQAYDEAARELFGEHARVNFPNGVDAWLEREAQQQERDDAPIRAAA